MKTSSIALFLGAGFAASAGLPATGGLLDGQVWVVSQEQERRAGAALSAWDSWRRTHGEDVAGFLHAAYHWDVQADGDTLPGTGAPWPWVTQYLAARLS